MAAPTVNVTCTANDQNGNPVAGALFVARLDRTEIYDGFVVPEQFTGVADADGVCVLQLWPNALGVASSQYKISAVNPDDGRRFLNSLATIPNNDCFLHEVMTLEPYPPINAAQQALVAAQAALAPVQEAAAEAQEYRDDALNSMSTAVAAASAASASAEYVAGVVDSLVPADSTPSIYGLPTIYGVAAAGGLLTAYPAQVVGVPLPSSSYQWFRNTAPIVDATALTYLVTAEDVGAFITFRQTAFNVFGSVAANSYGATISTDTGGGTSPLLAEARIFVDWSDAENHAGRWAENENATGTHTGNLISFPTGPMTNESGGSTPTRTRFLPDPSGVTSNAMRLVATANNQANLFHRSGVGHTLTAGVYTLKFRIRATSGTGPHAFVAGVSSAYVAGSAVDLDWTDPANEAATTFQTTFTYSSGDVAVRLNTSGASVEIDRLQLYPGDASAVPAWADEVFTAGRPPYAFSGAMTLAPGGLVDTAPSPSGLLLIDPDFPNAHAYDEYTIISVSSVDTASEVTAGHIANIHPTDGGNTTGNILHLESTAPYTGEVNTFPSGTRSQMAVNVTGKGLFALGQVRAAGSRRVYFDTIKTVEDSSSISFPVSVRAWTLGSWNTSQTADLRSFKASGRYAITGIWDRALTPAEYADAVTAMKARLSTRSVPMMDFDWHVISGDSNSTRANGDWSQLATAAGYHAPGADMLSMITSVGGQGIDNIDGTGNRFDLMDGPGLLRGTDSGRTAFYHLCIGTNDWDILDAYTGTNAERAAQYVVRVQELIQRALDLNPRVNVIWYSLLPQTAVSRPNWEDQRLEVNSLMRAWIGVTNRVHICDVGGSATIGSRALQAGGGGTYYLSDEIHLTPAGDAEFASIVRTSLATARAAAGI